MEESSPKTPPLHSPNRLNIRIVAMLALTCAVLGTVFDRVAGQGAASSLQLLSRDGRQSIPLTAAGGQEMIALDDLAAAFQLTVRDDGGAITVAYKGKSVVLTPDQTIASVGGRLISLPAPPTRSGNRWLVPLDFISRALASIYDVRLDLRRQSRLLVVGDLRVPRVTVRAEAGGNLGRTTIDVVPAATPSVAQQGTTRIVVHVDADALDVTLPPVTPGPFVQAIHLLDPTSIAIELGPRFNTFRSATQPIDDGMRVTVDVVGAVTDAVPATPPPAAAPADAPPLDLTGSSGAIRVIALDAGHGGQDVGAKGAGGMLEKDVSIGVARRLKALIEARLGLRVVMTRDGDDAVPIESRTALANNNKADVFVSLHVNAAARPTVSGATVFVAGVSQSDIGAGRSGSERLPVFGGGMRNIDIIPWNLAQIPHRPRSEQLAQAMVDAMTGHAPLAQRPIEHAPIRLLEAANMPAVLIEMGFLTNAEQEQALAGPELPAAIAQAVLDGIVRFREGGGNDQTGQPAR